MFTLLEAISFFFILITIGSAYWYLSIPKNLPPGPIGLPFIGSALYYWDGSKQHLLLQEDVKKYGPIFKMYIGNKLVIVLGSYETIQEALVGQGEVFAGRPQVQTTVSERIRHRGIVLAEGDLWKEHRRFALSTLRDFGVGRPILEPRIKEEIEYLIERMAEYSTTGLPFDPHRLMTCAISNIINQLLFGCRFSYDDEEFVRQFMALSRRTSTSGVSFLSPILISETIAKLLTFLPKVQKSRKETEEFLDYVEGHTRKTQSTYDPNSEPSNYIHAYMKMASTKKGQTSFTDTQLLATCNNLFVAGIDTTATTIRWAILFLAHYPNVQEKLYQEIKNNVGTRSLPSYGDRTKLPFAEAVVMETQRLADLTPMGVARRPLSSTKLMGYDIPNGTLIIPLLTNVLHNPQLYSDPLKFNPSRFLDIDGKVIRDPKLIPFQAGKRVCLGEPLARMELFLVLAGLVSHFRFYFPDDEPAPTVKPIVGFACSPAPYKVRVDSRNN